MSNAQNVKIFLLDESFLQIPVQPRLTVSELRDLVASHVNVRERCYFGLAFKEDGGGWNWLNNIKRVLDHDIPRINGQIVLYFLVQFYLESVRLLSDTNAYEQFYLHARRSLSEGELECDPQTMFRLIAFIMQIVYKDYLDDTTAVNNLKKLNAFPTWLFRSHPSLKYCETQVLEYYRANVGMEKGEALMDFLIVLESLPSYGYHYYEVQDKSRNSWWLGLNCRGIFVYDYMDKATPRCTYAWPQLREISHGRQKLTMEIYKRSKRSSSSSRRGFSSTKSSSMTSSVPTTITWYTTSQRAKVIAFAANEYRKFFELRRSTSRFYTPLRARDDVSFELTHRRHSFSRLPACDVSRGGEGLRQFSFSSCNLANMGTACSSDQISAIDDMTREDALVQREKLKDEKLVIMQTLLMKEAQLKRLLNEEFELTGAMPEEYNSTHSNEKQLFQRTSFLLSPYLVKRVTNKREQSEIQQEVIKLELEFATIKQIYTANKKMARETRKKSFRIACKENLDKLKKLQDDLDTLRQSPAMRGHHHLWHSRVSDLSCSLTNTTDTGSTRRTGGSGSDSISLQSSSGSSMDVSRRMSLASLQESGGPAVNRDTLIGSSSRTSLTTASEEAVISTTATSDMGTIPFTYPLIADCYIGHCSSPVHLARARYRDMMLYSNLPTSNSCSNSFASPTPPSPFLTTSTPSRPSNNPSPLVTNDNNDEDEATLVRQTSQHRSPSTQLGGKSEISDSGFVSLHKCDTLAASPTTPRRHSNGTLTRHSIVDARVGSGGGGHTADDLAPANPRLSVVEGAEGGTVGGKVDDILCARQHRLSVSDQNLFFFGGERTTINGGGEDNDGGDEEAGQLEDEDVFSAAEDSSTTTTTTAAVVVVPRFRYGRSYTPYHSGTLISQNHQDV